jgi:hypothetical protein
MNRTTQSKKSRAGSSSRFNHDLLIDVVAGACILVIAGRPDALAITFSAVIIAAAVVIYRATMGAKAYLATSGRGRVDTANDAGAFSQEQTDAEVPPLPARGNSGKSWLRE